MRRRRWRRCVVRAPPAEVAVAGEGADEGKAVLRVAVVVDRPVVVAVRVGVVHRRLVAVVMRPGMVEVLRFYMVVHLAGQIVGLG